MAKREAGAVAASLAYRRQICDKKDQSCNSCIIISEDCETSWDSDSQVLVLGEVSVDSVMGHDMKTRTGVLESTSQAAAVAALLAADGQRVRRLRGWACAGQWLRDTLDQVYDPVWTRLRDHLKDEGSVRILPLPEVEMVAEDELPGLSARALKRLRKAWPTMDHHLRSSALSELMMTVVRTSGQSAPRIEELGWHRVVAANWKSDLASQITRSARMWKERGASAAAGELVDSLLRSGQAPSFEPQD